VPLPGSLDARPLPFGLDLQFIRRHTCEDVRHETTRWGVQIESVATSGERYWLPWAPATINQSAVLVPVDAARGRGCACAEAADGSTSRGAGTSVTARMRNASGRFAAGRQ